MKVLLFSNDLMPFGDLPTSGGGLRAWQIMKGLECHGVEVIASMPGFTYLAERNFEKIPEHEREYLWSFGKQDAILRRVKPDAVIFSSNWDHFALQTKLSIPLIIDLHGSRLIETTMWGKPVSADWKVQVLSKADCLLAAGMKQRLYFYGWLVQAGRVPADEHFIRYIPISMPLEQPIRKPIPNDQSAPRFVSGGGWFPWQNQAKVIFSICEAVASRDKGLVEIYGTPHDKQGNGAEEVAIRDIYSRIVELSQRSSRVRVKGYVGRNELVDIYAQSSIAVEAMQYNLERELAFTTRTIEYLWCGLPVIYNNYSEISAHLDEYDAGWTIDPSSEREISGVIEEIFSKPEIIEQKSKNASRLVAERFTWSETIKPLLEFLKAPSIAKKVVPVTGVVYAYPSFMSLRGERKGIPLAANTPELNQHFVVPADNIVGLEVNLSPISSDIGKALKEVVFEVARTNGQIITRQVVSASECATPRRIRLRFPRFREPRGGERLIFKIRAVSCSVNEGNSRNMELADTPLLSITGLLGSPYPLIESNVLSAGDLPRTERFAAGGISASSISLTFIPAQTTKLYLTLLLVRRGLMMIRQGEWRRFLGALLRRISLFREHLRNTRLLSVFSKGSLVFFVTCALGCVLPPPVVESRVLSPKEVSGVSLISSGKDLALSGRPDQAEVHFRKAIVLYPRVDSIYNNLGYVLQLQERHEEAVKMFLRALELAPNELVPRDNLARSYYRLGFLEKAADEYTDLIREYYRLGLATARKSSEQFTDAQLGAVFRNLATIQYVLGKLDDAFCYSNIARQVHNTPYQNGLHARLLLSLNLSTEAAEHLRVFITEKNGEVPANLLLDYGLSLVATSSFDLATEALTRISTLGDADSSTKREARLLNILALVKLGRNSEAKILADALLDDYPKLCDSDPIAKETYWPLSVTEEIGPLIATLCKNRQGLAVIRALR